jgi:protein arginine N-methyltransferase 1
MAYDDILTHSLMLRDRIRTEAYQRAIEACVRSGDRVLDFGCGTGVLSIFAERAGAGRVFAVDRSSMLEAAQQVFADNGCTRIESWAGDGDTVELPDKVDVLVSEWMGHFLFAESMLEPLLRLRDAYLRPGGRMIPASCSLHVALVSARAEFEMLTFLRERPYGIDFSAISSWPFHEIATRRFKPNELFPDSACFGTLDLATITAPPRSLNARIVCSAAGQCFGLCGWFDAQLTSEIQFSTGPWAPATHWFQLFFPFDRALTVEPGQLLEITLRIVRLGDTNGFEWLVSTRGETRRGDNIVHQAWLARIR